MIWHQDEPTAQAAAQFPFPIHRLNPVQQARGYNFDPTMWKHRTIHRAWPPEPLRSDPNQIIQLFQADHYLEAFAMTVSWGGMSRARVYDGRDLLDIEHALQLCAESIQKTNQLQAAWLILTGEPPEHLGWSAVMASKTLHFLSRALNPDDHSPPVLRDGAVSLDYAWRRWVARVPPPQRPHNWKGNTFEAFNRYMTAILVWAEQRHWTTTQIETTIFDEGRDAKPIDETISK